VAEYGRIRRVFEIWMQVGFMVVGGNPLVEFGWHGKSSFHPGASIVNF
jgi:hypothetical protein